MLVQNKLEKIDSILDHSEGTPIEDKIISYKHILETLHVLDFLEMSDEDQKKDNIIIMRARNEFQYMMSFSMSEIVQLAEDISTQVKNFSKEEIIQDYLKAKNRIWLEMIVLLESEYNYTVNRYIENNERYRYILGLQNIQKDDELVESIVDSIKQEYYQTEIEKFFPIKNPKQAVKLFVDKCVEHGSFFATLELICNRPKNKTLKKTVTTWEERLRLLLLLRRILMYYPKGGVKEWGSIIEYQFQDLCICFVYKAPSQRILSSMQATLEDFFMLSVELFWKKEWDRILEVCVVCLRGMNYKNNKTGVWCPGELLKQVLERTEEKSKQILEKKLSMDLWKVIVDKQPCLREEGFYGGYSQRFSLEDMRIWNRIDVLVNEYKDWIGAKKELKKLNRHKDFFRRKFNMYLCDFYIIKNEIEYGSCAGSIENIKKIKKIYHDRNAMIINEYPTNQIKDKIEILSRGKDYLDKLPIC